MIEMPIMHFCPEIIPYRIDTDLEINKFDILFVYIIIVIVVTLAKSYKEQKTGKL